MDGVSELSDMSDWLQTSLPQLTPLESGLRCQVCKDFYDTPMITSCSHTFCSLCIRRCLTNDGKCPVCRSSDQEIRLRRNWSVQEIVDAFRHARPTLIGLITERSSTSKDKNISEGKRKYNEPDTSPGDDGDRRTRRRKQLKTFSDDLKPEVKSTCNLDEIQAVDLEFDDGLRACPICQQRMKEEEVFPHLDIHTQSDHEADPQNHAISYSPSVGPVSNTSFSTHPERLPQLNYSLFKENALRRKMIDLGIPSGGPKALLIRRHMEWVNLVNANCDSSRPKSKRELLQNLSGWDRSHGRVIPTGMGNSASTNPIMRKDFDGVAWGIAHNKDFERLIQEARQRASRKLDESPKSLMDNPLGLPTPEDILDSERVSTAEVPASEKVPHKELTADL